MPKGHSKNVGLVLSREVDEVILIGDDIRITITDIRGSKVRVGVLAPKDLPVHRLEVYEAIKHENWGAATAHAKAVVP